MINWLWAWLTYAKGARLITGPDLSAAPALDSRKAIDVDLDETARALDSGPGKTP